MHEVYEILKKHAAKIVAFLAGVASEMILDLSAWLRAMLEAMTK